ncbi:helix-turn-helix domain-containing protein [Streptomyces tauricus]
MTTSRGFSPADMAARRPAPPPKPAARPAPTAPTPRPAAPSAPQPQTAAEKAISPGVLADGERFKPTYHRGLMVSGMQPEARALGFALLWFASHKNGRISPTLQPSQQDLADASGLSIARVGVQLQVLRERGWLHLHRIEYGPRAGLPRFDLTIPALYLERVRAYRAAYQHARITD